MALTVKIVGAAKAAGLSPEESLKIYAHFVRLASSDEAFEMTAQQVATLYGWRRARMRPYVRVLASVGAVVRNGKTWNVMSADSQEVNIIKAGVPADLSNFAVKGSSNVSGKPQRLDGSKKKSQEVKEKEPKPRGQQLTDAALGLHPTLRTAYALVMQKLDGVSEKRRVSLANAERVATYFEKFPDRDHVGSSDRFLFHYTEGNGENWPIKNVTSRWHTWISRQPSLKASQRGNGGKGYQGQGLRLADRERAIRSLEEGAGQRHDEGYVAHLRAVAAAPASSEVDFFTMEKVMQPEQATAELKRLGVDMEVK